MLQEEESPEVEKKLQSIFKVIANHFVEPAKAEEHLQKLHQMKDEGVFTALSTLLSPSTSVAEAARVRVRVTMGDDRDRLSGVLGLCVLRSVSR